MNKQKKLNKKKELKHAELNKLKEVKNRPNSISVDDIYKSPVIEDLERRKKELYQVAV